MEIQKDDEKGMKRIHSEHWEMDVSDSVFPKAKKKDQLDNWIAKEPPKWPRTHVKVNDEDY